MASGIPPAAGVPALTSVGVRVFISYCEITPDADLAEQLHDLFADAGHQPFMASKSVMLGDRWPTRIDEELEACDVFLVLLSHQSVTSEMVLEEVKRAKSRSVSRAGTRPVILPIRVDLPLTEPLPFDLSGYLGSIQQREWRLRADNSAIVTELLSVARSRSLRLIGDDPIGRRQNCNFVDPYSSGPPLPAAAPELPEGQVDLTSSFYVDRPPIEESCYCMIERPGSLIRIKAPRQMGKTSLMARILRHATTLGHRAVSLSFQLADGDVFGELDRLLSWFCSSVTWRCGLSGCLEDFGNLTGSKIRSTAYFEQSLLRELSSPLTLGLDEVDLVFQNPGVAGDFFALLRTWHEFSKAPGIWRNLQMVIVHSTEVYIPLSINQSPFNIGKSVDLSDFNPTQVRDLAQRHGLEWTPAVVEKLMRVVGGHPFLVRIALYHIARGEMSLEQLIASAATEAGRYGDHLRRHLWNLEKNTKLRKSFLKVVESADAVRLDSEQAFKLESMGLASRRGNEVRPRYELYRAYFQDRLRF